jgi:glycosyltransferase involved in cell wall biosynthesis
MYGDNIALMNIMPDLMAKGVEPLFMLQREGDFSHYLQKHGYRYVICKFLYNHIYSLSNPRLSYLKHFIKHTLWNLFGSKYVKDALTLLSDFNPQLIHTNNSANRFGLVLAKKLNIQHVWHIREYMDLDHCKGFFPSKRHFEKLLSYPDNTCVCITEDVSAHFKTSSVKKVIYDGVITEDEHLFEITEKENVLLYVGRLIESKGVVDLVNAFSRIVKDHPNYRLNLIGDGDKLMKSKLQRIVHEKNIADKVDFMGYQTNVYDYMKVAKAIIISSPYEAFGLITAEAMDNGCLVIGRNTAGTKVQCDNGLSYTGAEIALRYNNIAELEMSLRYAITMPSDIYWDMVSRAHCTAAFFYNVTNCASNVLALYNTLLSR